MSSSQTYRASSKEVYDNAYGQQMASYLPQYPIGSLKNKAQLALTFQSLDADLRAEERTRWEPKREPAVTATSNSGPAGHLYGPTGPEIRQQSGALFQSEDKNPRHGSRADPPEVLATERTNRTARAPSQPKHNPLRKVASSQLQCPNGTARAPLSFQDKPLGHQLKAGPGDDACLVAPACEGFQEQMRRIPAEICQMIMDMVFEEAFGPQRVHPHKDPPIMNIFLALDKEFHRKFHEQYWTKNTWVISKGPLNKTMRFMTEKPYNETTTEFSRQIPNKAALQIRSAELSFSNADTPDLPEWQQLAGQSAALQILSAELSFSNADTPDLSEWQPLAGHSAPPYVNPSQLGPFATKPPNDAQTPQMRMRRAQRYHDIQYQLVHTWQDKFDRIAMLNLTHLTLDFTEAYDPGGLYLGVYLVRRLIAFAHGIPADFKILAPDRWMERQIRDAFLVLNGRD